MLADELILGFKDLILITGANGFIGSKIVETLLRYGFKNLRCFVRPTSNLDKLSKIVSSNDEASIEIFKGNLLSSDDCNKAVKGVSVIYHLAAGIEKSFAGCFLNSAVITRNLLEAIVTNNGIVRFLNVSSFAVYSNYTVKRNAVLDETCEIESQFMHRSAYCFGKVKQDELLLKYSNKYNINYVIVRPGSVYGPGTRQLIPPRLGSGSFGIFFLFRRLNKIPFTYIDNCADAIGLAGIKKGVDGEVFNIVDDDLPNNWKFLRMYKKNVSHFKSIYIPYRVFYFFCFLWEKYSKWSKEQLPPVFNRRKCAALWKGNRYSNHKIKQLLGWKPKVSFNEAVKPYFNYLRTIGKTK